jgi:hypothetical protein
VPAQRCLLSMLIAHLRCVLVCGSRNLAALFMFIGSSCDDASVMYLVELDKFSAFRSFV